MKSFTLLIIILLFITLSISACDLLPIPGISSTPVPLPPPAGTTPLPPPPPTVPPAQALLPTLSGYNTVEGQLLTDYISTLSEGAALLTGQPQLAATIGAVDAIVSCYQEVGAIRARLYSQQGAPLMAGTVAVADRNALLDPVNLFRCATPFGNNTQALITIEPCTGNYTLTRDDGVFYVLYAGTTPEMCQLFCSNLEGCTAE